MDSSDVYRTCPFCAAKLTIHDNLCPSCRRPPSSDKYTLLKESLMFWIQDMKDEQRIAEFGEEDESKFVANRCLIRSLDIILNEVISQAEFRAEHPGHCIDCLRTASGTVVRNAVFTYYERTSKPS